MPSPFESLPSKVQNSALIKALEAKLPAITGIGFNYAAELCQLYADVKPEVARMALLFPEYTPHDTDLHLDRLFPLSEKLLSNDFFEALTCDELFLLAVGLIAHDWGMAIGDKEICALIAGGKLIESEQDGFALLDNESRQLSLYAEECRLHKEDDSYHALTQAKAIAPEADSSSASDARYAMQRSPLPEYVRRTHAWRSGARLKRRWKNAFPALAEAAAEVCIGHWLDLSKIDTQNPFVSPRPLFGHSLPPNLRAIALAVRLTDLFDIGIDRTPYALWRYIRPQDLISNQEWNKHRCLDPVITESDTHGLYTPVLSGTVTDHQVWAAIVDLRRYCDEQLRGCADIMRRHHHIDALQRGCPLPWKLRSEVAFRVEPRGFKPVDIRFEFDRQNILHLLGSLLYKGDAYVFLRELLQNAIDATRLRRARQRVEAETDPNSRPPRGIIYFEVKHGDGGNATIICRDSGIGMDEVTVRNYLAKSGVSFWQSDQFQNMNPDFTPIGCFGIGMLSCFSVADEVEILTKRYDWPAANTDPIRIKIPNVAQQFRVEQAPDATPFGTAITVHVKGEKLRELWGIRHAVKAAKISKTEYPTLALNVTEYLKRIAGFVRFPIVVDEHDKRTVIVHPDYEALTETEEDGNSLRLLERDATAKGMNSMEIHRLVRDVGWNDSVKSHFEDATVKPSQKVFDLKKDLGPEMTSAGMDGIEGWVIYAEPSDPWSEFNHSSGLQITSPFTSDQYGGLSYKGKPNIDRPNGISFNKDSLDSVSSTLDNDKVFYRDGLLVSGLRPATWRLWNSSSNYTIIMAINLPPTSPHKFEPSRLSFNGIDQNWSDFIWDGIHNWVIRNQIIEDIIKSTAGDDQQSLQKRFFSLGNIINRWGIKAKWLAARVPWGEFPVPRIFPDRRIEMTLAKNLGADPYWIAPHSSVFDPNWTWKPQCYQSDESEKKRQKMAFIEDPCMPDFSSSFDLAAGCAWNACVEHLKLSLGPQQCRWLVPPTSSFQPVLQRAYGNSANMPDLQTIILRVSEDPSVVSPDQLNVFLEEVIRIVDAPNVLHIYPFPKPFADRFSKGDDLNSLNSSVQWLMRVLATLIERSEFDAPFPEPGETWKELVSKIVSPFLYEDGSAVLETSWKKLIDALNKKGYILAKSPPPPPEEHLRYLPTYMLDNTQADSNDMGENEEAYEYPDQAWGYIIPSDWKSGEAVPLPQSTGG